MIELQKDIKALADKLMTIQTTNNKMLDIVMMRLASSLYRLNSLIEAQLKGEQK